MISKMFYKNIEEYNIGEKRKILIVLDDMIADIINDKRLNSIVTELLIILRQKIKHFSCFYYAIIF